MEEGGEAQRFVYSARKNIRRRDGRWCVVRAGRLASWLGGELGTQEADGWRAWRLDRRARDRHALRPFVQAGEPDAEAAHQRP